MESHHNKKSERRACLLACCHGFVFRSSNDFLAIFEGRKKKLLLWTSQVYGALNEAVTSLRAPGLRSWGGGCWRCWGDALGASPGLSVQPGGLSGLAAEFSSHLLQPGALKGSQLCSLSLPWGSSWSPPPCFLLGVLSVGWVTLRIQKTGFEKQKQKGLEGLKASVAV